MSNPYYNNTSNPATNSAGSSATIRAEFAAIAAGFDKLPGLPLAANTAVVINGVGTGFTVTAGTLALAGAFATTGAFSTTLAQGANVTLTLPLVNGTVATLAGTETLSNKTLVAPALGTPASGVATNLTGTAAGLTAGNVTTNANLTGPITSSGNATSVASQTGTGTKFVMDTSPTLVTPTLGVATATSINGNAVPTASDTVALLAASQTLSNKTLASSVTATTQSANDNSNKLATTGYLDGKLGQNNGIATLDSSGKLTSAQIPPALIGALNYQGTWNASTNAPTLASGTGTKGFYYVVSVAGTTSLDGITQWNIGDSAVFNGAAWNKIDGIANEVVSVAGKTGIVTLAASDLTNGVQGSGAVVLATSPTITTPTISGALTYGGVTLTANVTGTGKMVLDTSPTLVTPTLGAATATTINGNTLTAGSYTVTGAAGKTLTFSNSLTLAGTDATTITFQGTDTYVGRATTDTLSNKTLASGTVATTQAAADNSTKLATTAYADRTAVQQVVNTTTGAVATGTTTIPLDDTTPQNTEGDQYMSLSITPKSATSKLVIEGIANLSSDLTGGLEMQIALFQDSTANALGAWASFVGVQDGLVAIPFRFVMTSGTTSATTFKLRAGGNAAATTTFNGAAGARKYGGVMASSITISEIGA